jgi:hypothetical protein
VNFAFFSGFPYYHAASDTLDRLDSRSLAQQVGNAAALGSELGNADLARRFEAPIFFDMAGRWMIVYGRTMALWAAMLASTAYIACVWLRRKQRGGRKGIVLGAVAVPLSASIACVCAGGIVHWLTGSHPAARYAETAQVIAIVVTSALVTWCLSLALARLSDPLGLALGSLMWWVTLTILTSITEVGASYLFVWPTVGAAGALIMVGGADRSGPWWRDPTLLACGTLPLAMLWPPIILALHAALPGNPYIVPALTVFCLSVVIPQAFFIWRRGGWFAIPALALATCAAWAFVLRTSFDTVHPQQDSVLYIASANDAFAVWTTPEQREWSRQFFSKPIDPTPDIQELRSWYRGVRYGNSFALAPPPDVEGPSIKLLSDKRFSSRRVLNVLVRSPRQAPELTLRVSATGPVVAWSLDGQSMVRAPRPDAATVLPAPPSMASNRVLTCTYFAPPPDGLNFQIETEGSGPVRMQVVDHSYELPTNAAVAKPGGAVVTTADTILIGRFSF